MTSEGRNASKPNALTKLHTKPEAEEQRHESCAEGTLRAAGGRGAEEGEPRKTEATVERHGETATGERHAPAR